MTIDGVAVSGATRFPVGDPARGEPFGRAPECSPGQPEEAMAAAARVFGPWSLDESHRRTVLVEAADALEEAAGEIAPVLTAERGKPLAGARGEELWGWMTAHPAVRKISFTGSVATGKKVAAAAAPDLKRMTLELGGNDPAIVLDDADVDRVADRLFASAFANCGQVCIAVKRVYAPERLYGALVDALGERARTIRVGDGREEGTELGPINNQPQMERVLGLLGDATARGARVVAGGRRLDRPGYFVEPTIVAGVEDGARLVDEEQFGPVLPVVAYRDLDEVTARANDTHFGLGGSVWSADTDRAEAVARKLECGTVWVNTHGALAPEQPFGGVKWSGVGVEHGLPGLFGYTEMQVVHRLKG